MLLTIAAAGCAPPNGEIEETTVGETVQNDDFRLSVWADNSTYKANEFIECCASVEYLGQDGITVYHSDPLLVFYIKGGKFDGKGARQDELNKTDFAPQDEIIMPFKKSGGWSADDPNAAFFQAFYADKELILPPGQYKLCAQIAYSTDKDDMRGPMSTIEASVFVTVQE